MRWLGQTALGLAFAATAVVAIWLLVRQMGMDVTITVIVGPIAAAIAITVVFIAILSCFNQESAIWSFLDPGAPILPLLDQCQRGEHRGVSRDEFVEAFAESDIPAEIAAAVYDYYSYEGGVFSKKFRASPDDDYEHVLSKGDEDIDDDALFLIQSLDLKMPSTFAAARFETNIRTLRDMVLWLHWVQQHQRDSALKSQ